MPVQALASMQLEEVLELAPEETRRARVLFARKIIGTAKVTDAGVVLVDADLQRVAVEISSVPLVHGDHVVGVFGQVSDLVETPHAHTELHLTPRQAEVLELLERGRSTRQIADELHLSIETVRNHSRHLRRPRGAHSRLKSVASAHQTNSASGLLPWDALGKEERHPRSSPDAE